MGYIRGICISKERGTAKHEVESAKFIPDWGIEGDAHAGHWHRQVSLLSLEKINEFRAKGADVAFGAFGENLIVEGFDLRNLPIGTQLRSGDVLLEITQIGKECHSHCEIYKRMGECIMPREGVFARVLHGGRIDVGIDAVEWAMKVDKLGAGEILLTSMDCDGTKAGYDLELTRTIAENVSIPVIASGGAGTMEHFYDALTEGKADAALAASLFHYKELEIRQVKEYLRDRKVPVRLVSSEKYSSKMPR